MNVRLYSGTVRCLDCMDASSYESETSDPCLYCGAVPTPPAIEEPETDQEWLDALSTLVVTAPRKAVQMSKIQCSWCSDPASWAIIDVGSSTEYACTEHGRECAAAEGGVLSQPQTVEQLP